MKFYETLFDEYVKSAETCPLHPEIPVLPRLGNLIVYGPSGVGKYTQVLRILKPHSPSQLRYDKRVVLTIKKQSKKTSTAVTATSETSLRKPVTTKKPASAKGKGTEAQKNEKTEASNDSATGTPPPPPPPRRKPAATAPENEKQSFSMVYRIGDAHYEIDMSLLGCNAKQVWHEVYSQIVDIVSVRPDRQGVIVCKNFHAIHSDLLEIIYSYVQPQDLFGGEGIRSNLVGEGRPAIRLYYILITEHLSFLPSRLTDRFAVLRVGRPSPEAVVAAVNARDPTGRKAGAVAKILDDIGGNETVLNIKEVLSWSAVSGTDELPKDNFNIICDALLHELDVMAMPGSRAMASLPTQAPVLTATHVLRFRDALYDILIYGLDASECIWYVFRHYVDRGRIPPDRMMSWMTKFQVFTRQYGNNYRAIFHLESIFLDLLAATLPENVCMWI